MAKRSSLKGLRKFGKFRVLLVAAGLVVAGLAVAFIYAGTTCTTSNGSTTCTTTQTGSSSSGDCINGQVTSTSGTNSTSNSSCSTQNVSGGNTNTCFNDNCSTSGGTTTNTVSNQQPASGGLACSVLSASSIRWRASWQDAPGIVVLAYNGNSVHRFKGAGPPATGSETWEETGLKSATAYRGELRHNYNGASTIISTRSCRTPGEPSSTTKSTSTNNNSSTSSTAPGSVSGQVVVCNNNLCTTYSSGGTTGSTKSTVTTQVCQNGICKTYTSESSSGGVGQSLTCVNGNCSYEAHEAVPVSGVKGFFVNLYLSLNGFFSHLF